MNKTGMWRLAFLFSWITLVAGPANAHAFKNDGGGYERFIEGVLVIVAYPSAILPLVTLGIFLSLWQKEGFLKALPAMLVGAILGLGLGAVSGPWILPATQAAGGVVAILAALLTRPNQLLALGMSFVLTTMVVALSVEGHGFLELPLMIHLGIFFGLYLVVAAVSSWTRLTLEHIDKSWVRIIWRIAASWIAALMILYVAFTLNGS